MRTPTGRVPNHIYIYVSNPKATKSIALYCQFQSTPKKKGMYCILIGWAFLQKKECIVFWLAEHSYKKRNTYLVNILVQVFHRDNRCRDLYIDMRVVLFGQPPVVRYNVRICDDMTAHGYCSSSLWRWSAAIRWIRWRENSSGAIWFRELFFADTLFHTGTVWIDMTTGSVNEAARDRFKKLRLSIGIRQLRAHNFVDSLRCDGLIFWSNNQQDMCMG